MFKIGNTEFKVKSAKLKAIFFDAQHNKNDKFYIGEESSIRWYLDIYMEDGELPPYLNENSNDKENVNDEDDLYYSECASPRLYINNGVEIEKIENNDWRKLEGLVIEVNDPQRRNYKNETWCLYAFEHEDITSGKIEILSRNKNSFHIRWTGKAHVGFADEPEEGVSFIFDDNVIYDGLRTSCDEIKNIKKLKSELSKFVNVEDYFLVSEEKLRNRYICEFKPIELSDKNLEHNNKEKKSLFSKIFK